MADIIFKSGKYKMIFACLEYIYYCLCSSLIALLCPVRLLLIKICTSWPWSLYKGAQNVAQNIVRHDLGKTDPLKSCRNKLLATKCTPFSESLYRSQLKGRSPGLVNFVPALAYHFCLAMPAAFTQPGDHILAEPCSNHQKMWLWWERSQGQGNTPPFKGKLPLPLSLNHMGNYPTVASLQFSIPNKELLLSQPILLQSYLLAWQICRPHVQ